MTHERLLELVAQVNGALAIASWPFVIFDAFGKSASIPDLKAKLDLRRDQIFSTIILDIEEAMRPFWPTPRERPVFSEAGEPSTVLEVPTVLGDDARDAVRDCLAQNERLFLQAARVRRLTRRVSLWDKCTFYCTLGAAILALCGLGLWLFYDGMSDRIARLTIVVPLLPAILALGTAATRQFHMQKANDALIEEEDEEE